MKKKKQFISEYRYSFLPVDVAGAEVDEREGAHEDQGGRRAGLVHRQQRQAVGEVAVTRTNET